MKREIKFRGLNSKGAWIYGMPTYDMKYMFEHESINSVDNYEIDPKTVGQYTGLKDKNEKEIYEGDIVISKCDVSVLYVVKFGQYMYSDACFFLEEISDINPPLRFFSRGIEQTEIIGNIYQNPELLETVP